MNPWRMDSAAPLSDKVCSNKIAPKMIHSSDTAMSTPRIEAASTCTTDTCQKNSAKQAVIAYATGMARVAGQRSATRNTITARIGRRAMKALRAETSGTGGFQA